MPEGGEAVEADDRLGGGTQSHLIEQWQDVQRTTEADFYIISLGKIINNQISTI